VTINQTEILMHARRIAIAIGLLCTFVLSACGLVLRSADESGTEVHAYLGNNPGLVATTTAIGTVVADSNGWILYRSNNDATQPPQSNCDGACATMWRAVTWFKDCKLDGVDAKYVGKVQRADGSWQTTLNGWPLYRFAGDAKPGDLTGHGVAGVWHAVPSPTPGTEMTMHGAAAMG
jgi:predicted lipoprotein with Yx(FWY)xxD motif